MKIKKGDTVVILAGKDKGKKGKVSRVFPKLRKVIIEGANMSKKHQRPRKSGEKGSMVDMAMPLDASNAKRVN